MTLYEIVALLPPSLTDPGAAPWPVLPASSSPAFLTMSPSAAPLLARIADFAGMLAGAEDEVATRALHASRTTGGPVGAAD